jgi:hypothetical protein
MSVLFSWSLELIEASNKFRNIYKFKAIVFRDVKLYVIACSLHRMANRFWSSSTLRHTSKDYNTHTHRHKNKVSFRKPLYWIVSKENPNTRKKSTLAPL